jgi:hypothetical protein
MAKTPEQVAAWQENSARSELPRLEELAQQLEALVRDVFTPPIAYQDLGGADTMALSFATKQDEHLRSVRTLVAAGLHRDALLIARAMLEAGGRLRWAFNRVPERTDLWFWYGAILDRRQMDKNKRDGLVVDPADEAALQPHVDRHGPSYYRPEVRRRIADAQQAGAAYALPDDPWHKGEWADTDVRSMFAELGEERLYDSFYRRTSEWAHSGPRAVLIAADRRREDVPEWGPDRFDADDVVSGVWALGVACESLVRTLEVVDAHFSLGHDERLNAIAERLDAVFAASLASAP